jgi:hypothetical protein
MTRVPWIDRSHAAMTGERILCIGFAMLQSFVRTRGQDRHVIKELSSTRAPDWRIRGSASLITRYTTIKA